MTPYEKVFKVFLNKIRDVRFTELAFEIAEEELIMLLNESVIDFDYPKVDLEDKDDELQVFNEDLTFAEIHILADGMVLHWAKTMLRDIDNLSYDMTPEEMRTTSKANHLNSLMRFEDKLSKDLKDRKNRYGRTERNKSLFYQLGGDGNNDG